jgi:hypothetical protein
MTRAAFEELRDGLEEAVQHVRVFYAWLHTRPDLRRKPWAERLRRSQRSEESGLASKIQGEHASPPTSVIEFRMARGARCPLRCCSVGEIDDA